MNINKLIEHLNSSTKYRTFLFEKLISNTTEDYSYRRNNTDHGNLLTADNIKYKLRSVINITRYNNHFNRNNDKPLYLLIFIKQ